MDWFILGWAENERKETFRQYLRVYIDEGGT